MALPAQDRAISRRNWLLAGLAIPLSRLRGAAAEPLGVSFDGDNLHISTPGLHFLTGKPLERLKDASTVTFLSKITLYSDSRGTVFRPGLVERFVVSWDLWEEKFSVTIPGASRQSQAHLSAAQAETWAIDNLAISALGLATDRPFWLRFELRAATQKDVSKLLGEGGRLSLSGLVEFFGRRATADDPSWMRSAGPFRLADLPRTNVRGTRIW